MRFEVKPHTTRPGQQMVEVLSDAGEFIAAIYPHAEGLHVASKFMSGFRTASGMVPIPGVLVQLDHPRK